MIELETLTELQFANIVYHKINTFSNVYASFSIINAKQALKNSTRKKLYL